MAEHTSEHPPKPGHGKNMIALLAYLWILIVIPFLTESKNDPFVKYHLKQGLALLIFDFVGWILGFVVGWIPFIGWIIIWAWSIAGFVFVLIGLLNVLNGQEKELPVIGHYAHAFKF